LKLYFSVAAFVLVCNCENAQAWALVITTIGQPGFMAANFRRLINYVWINVCYNICFSFLIRFMVRIGQGNTTMRMKQLKSDFCVYDMALGT
jgi:hypothetical protein